MCNGAAPRNQVLLQEYPEAAWTWSLSGWRLFLGGIWMHVLTLSKGWQPQPVGQIQPLSCFSTAHTQKIVFTFLKRFLKLKEKEIFWSMFNFFEIQISESINKVLMEWGQVHSITFCLWLLCYCNGRVGQLSPWYWPLELKLFTNWVLYKMFEVQEKAQSVKCLPCNVRIWLWVPEPPSKNKIK